MKKRTSKIPYIRKFQHIRYVEKMVVFHRNKVASSALMFGKINSIDRILFLKYNDYLSKLINKEK